MRMSYLSNVKLKELACYAALLAFPVLAWLGGVDTLSDDHLDLALGAAGAVYATARGINALVSVLQGTELDLVFITFTIGEILDPVNDLIERFSSVVLFAIGAIAAQKVLLVMVSHSVFNYLLTAIAVLTAWVYAVRHPFWLEPLAKAFVIAVFVRFALAIVVIGNYWVDYAFLQQVDQQRHEDMKTFQSELRSVEQTVSLGEDFFRQLEDLQRQQEQLNAQVREQDGVLAGVQAELDQLDARVDALQKNAGLACRATVLSPTCPDDIKLELQNRSRLDQIRVRIKQRKSDIQQQIETGEESMECINKRMRGENCSIWDSLPSAPNLVAVKARLESLEDQVTDFTTNAWMLLMSLLIKSVLIPLIFLYGLVKITGLVWRLNLD